MWKSQLEEKDNGYKVIYLNAWEYDFDDEPLIPIANALLEEIKPLEELGTATKALQGLIGASALIGNSVLAKTSGIDALKVMTTVEKELNESTLQILGERLSGAFKLKKDIYNNLREGLEKFIESLEKAPLFVFVDELDRVRPDYAIKFLEAIKHIFAVEGICFVLAVDRNQLEASVKQLYGNIDFNNYYLRFVTREASLPDTKNFDLNGLVQKFFQKYLEDPELNLAITPEKSSGLCQTLSSLCRSFALTPRQIEHFFRIFSLYIAVETPQDTIARDSWLYMSGFLICLIITDRKDVYHRLGAGTIGPQELSTFIDALHFRKEGEKHYLTDACLAFCLSEDGSEYHDEAIAIIQERKGIGQDSDAPSGQFDHGQRMDTIHFLSKYIGPYSGFDSKSGFQMIYDKIENWKALIE